ncbi:PREDICTED: uncharacterized protein LOC100633078 [Amphimedon queenslandica]|uniref:CCHC-type domain-containing protein n=1 Tax=Amphimedon queenslandica TaxID=400682 RepID=A0A1X7VDT9_AMPQE|nr:PREDICTED: uncharacterized protein LOC100633078 [Amphimedon queenslandica]|eukprot:XP_011410528.1 PREDICTED: uncharacterized protein LOC100633078 [Amphimedon queenslandica]
MAAELAHKKSVRSGHRGTVTRKVTELETALGATPLDRDSLEQLRAALAEKVAVLKDLDESILALLEDEAEIETDIEGAEVIRDTLRSALFKIDKAIGPPSGAPRGVSPTVGDTPSESVATRIKLPELTLTPFDGDYTKWKTFWDSFESAIHNRRDLSDIDKFTYLRSLLIRSAKEAVAGLSLTSSNYQEAIDILKKRFGDESQIITKHMEAFTGLEAVTDNQNLSALRRLYDKVEIHVRGLRSLGIAHSAYGALLTPLLMRKLPQELRVLISRKMSGKEWEFNPILAALLEEIEARERAGIIHKSSNAYTRTKRESATATTLTTKDSGHSECCYCSEKHEPSLCKNVVLIEPRKQILKGRGYCFNCLRKGHRVRDCRAPPKCTECKSKHHPSICLKAVKSESSKETLNLQVNVSNLNPEAPPFTSLSSTSQAEENDTVLLQTVRVTAFNPSNPALCREAKVILDSGSQRSYVTQDLKKEMALKVKSKKSMSIAAFGSTTQREEEYDIVEIGLRTEEGSIILRLLAVPLICGPIPAAPIEISKRYYEHLSNLDLAVPDEGEPQILIGLDYYWSVVSGEVIQASSGPSALYTKFGWVLSGPMSGIMHDSSAALITHVLKVETGPTNREIDKRLRSFWDLESLGIVDTEEAVYEQLSSHISLCNGRYKLSLPWKDPCASVPDNFSLSKRRLLSLLKRLRKTPDLLIEYDRVIQHQKQMGIVELIEDPSRQDGNRVHYLPHHAIIRKDRETSKVRIVYDASASENGPSLNACLHTGPKFNQKIMEILLRFRVHKVALAADIEKAFLMITIDKRDRDVLRFLWIDDLYKDPPFFIVLRFTRVVFGVTSSPFLLNATIKFHLESLIESNRKLVNKLLRSFYVDDLVTGAKTEEEAFLLYSDAKDLMKKGGFNLCKFCSNSEVLQKKIDLLERRVSGPSIVDNKEKTYAQSVLQNSQKSSEGEKKILGVLWNVISDDIVLNFCNIFDKANESEPSKRHIVSLAGRFYDPLGLAAPVIIKFKVLVQELCRAKVQWDETLTGKLLERWQLLVKEFVSCLPIRIPRCYTQSLDDVESFQLVGFCDASSVAYAAVVYLRMRSGEMTITRHLLPRLE